MNVNLIGTTLRGRYYVIKQLGRGGIGITFLAEDRQCFNCPCVVKQLKPQRSDRNTLAISRRLFAEEANTLVDLGSHAQIPRLLAYFEENEEFFLVQEFIDGYDLTQEIIPEHSLSETQVIELLKDICNVLVFIQQHGVIHRDLKPSNLMRRKSDGKIIVIDFGAVKRISTHVANTQGQFTPVTPTVVIQSQGYTASEQMNGFPSFSSDIYSVGIIAIQAITGLFPKQLSFDDQGEIIWRGRIRSEYKYSPNLLTIIERMVRYLPQERYQSAIAVLEDLAQLENNQNQPNFTTLSPQNNQPKLPELSHKISVRLISILGTIIVILSFGFWKLLTPTKTTFLTYSDPEYGIKINYPKDWSTEPRNDFFTTGIIFTAPDQETQNNFQENISVMIEELSTPLSLSEYTNQSIQEIKKLSDPNLTSASVATLANGEARKVVYHGEEGRNKLQRMQIWTIRNNRVYIITYTAEAQKYQKFSPIVNKMLNSFVIIK
ncbi:serine/threonine protein kinase [Stanieria cyanosphaera PCC 7437]|uniref:non-specific serine/threonine protein kinase n=1 Tax=Stanieria cyanosphaera (strain ATCC 29371 / PCC 7437) TaxID=111780 RepID=K9XPN6_STAC7|nr:serine/threonine-protein kinase [Stanieria cyanosphaera]AFZ34054.1 serine/threonine protein kinase [Stanieria cyanosphaera PCC 7437]